MLKKEKIMGAFNAKKIKKGDKDYLMDLSEDDPNYAEKEIIFITLTGSRLYGTQYEKGENPLDSDYVSDTDIRGVYIESPYNYLRVNPHNNDTAQVIDEEDEEYFSLLKFVKMAAENNPNILDVLFAPDEAIIYENPLFKKIRDNKDKFLTQAVKDKFVGYAESQLIRLKNHRKYLVKYPDIHNLEDAIKKAHENKDVDFNWISHRFSGGLAKKVTGLSDSDRKPKYYTVNMNEFKHKYGVDFDLTKYLRPSVKSFMSVKDKDMEDISEAAQERTLDKLSLSGSYKVVSGDLVELRDSGNGIFSNDGGLIKNPSRGGDVFGFAKINSGKYKEAKKENASLWSWHIGRNEKRAELERVYGYDTKHAMHLFRLLLNAKKLVLTGEYNPRLDDKELELVFDVREGRIGYDEVIERSKKIKEELNELIKMGMHKIPNERADVKFIDSVVSEIYKEYVAQKQEPMTKLDKKSIRGIKK